VTAAELRLEIERTLRDLRSTFDGELGRLLVMLVAAEKAEQAARKGRAP